MSRTNQHVVIVGGASGLGRELLIEASRKGHRIAFLDINDTRAKQLGHEFAESNIEYIYQHCDIRHEEECRRALERISQRWGHIDIIIQAAGVASAGLVETVTKQQWQKQLDVNLLGTVNINQAALRIMKQQRFGHLVNVAALVGLLPTPSLSSYAATNAAIIAYSESLYAELEPLNIKVSVVCPSFFKSNLNERLYTTDPIARARFERLLNRPDLPTDEIARRTFKQIESQRFFILPHPNSHVMWRQKRWFPERFYRSLKSLAQKVRPAP